MAHVAFGSALLRLTATSANLIPRLRRDGRHYTLALIQKGKRYIQHITSPKKPRDERYKDLPQFKPQDLAQWHAEVGPAIFFEWATRTLRIGDEREFTVFVPRRRVLGEVVGLIHEIQRREPQLMDLIGAVAQLAADDGAFDAVPLNEVPNYGVLGGDRAWRPIQLAAVTANKDGTSSFFLVAYFPHGLLWMAPGWFATPIDAFSSERVRDIALKPVGRRFWLTLQEVSDLFGDDHSWISRLRSGSSSVKQGRGIVDILVMALTTITAAASKALPAVAIIAGAYADAVPTLCIGRRTSSSLRYCSGELVASGSPESKKESSEGCI